MADEQQPNYSGGLTQAANRAERNMTAGQRKLEQLQFDPIEKLIERHRVMDAELTYLKQWKEGNIQVLTGAGKPRTFPWDVYLKLMDQMASLEEKLLRFGYGRVSETNVIEHKERAPLVINLGTGGRKVVNGDAQ